MGDWWIDETPYPGPVEAPNLTWPEIFASMVQSYRESGAVLARHFQVVPTRKGQMEALEREIAKLFGQKSVRVNGGGIHLQIPDEVWVTPAAIRNMTTQVQSLAKIVGDATTSAEKTLEALEKREIGRGRAKNVGPRTSRTFGRGGRKQY